MSLNFVSYARDDDPAFVQRLARAPEETGHPVWLDRAQMPSRGPSWRQELREATGDCVRMLVVVDPAALASPRVRLELEEGVRCDKPLLPVLRIGRYEDIPPCVDVRDEVYLRELLGQAHGPDFRNDDGFAAALDELRRLLRQPAPPSATCGRCRPCRPAA